MLLSKYFVWLVIFSFQLASASDEQTPQKKPRFLALSYARFVTIFHNFLEHDGAEAERLQELRRLQELWPTLEAETKGFCETYVHEAYFLARLNRSVDPDQSIEIPAAKTTAGATAEKHLRYIRMYFYGSGNFFGLSEPAQDYDAYSASALKQAEDRGQRRIESLFKIARGTLAATLVEDCVNGALAKRFKRPK